MKQQPLHNTSHFIELGAAHSTYRLPIVIRKHRTSKRMSLRYQPLHHHLLLTIPRYVTIKQGLLFVEEKRRWIEKQVDETMQHFPFKNGVVIPFLGQKYTLSHIGGRGIVHIEGDMINVPGDEAFMSRRVHDWLKQQARKEMSEMARQRAAIINKTIKQVTVRDTTSRWGSCSHNGHLSFSWRLVFAPYEVFEYVICHEVAHLQEFNHSDAFWQIVERLCPGHDRWRHWLTAYGQTLYAYGNDIPNTHTVSDS